MYSPELSPRDLGKGGLWETWTNLDMSWQPGQTLP